MRVVSHAISKTLKPDIPADYTARAALSSIFNVILVSNGQDSALFKSGEAITYHPGPAFISNSTNGNRNISTPDLIHHALIQICNIRIASIHLGS